MAFPLPEIGVKAYLEENFCINRCVKWGFFRQDSAMTLSYSDSNFKTYFLLGLLLTEFVPFCALAVPQISGTVRLVVNLRGSSCAWASSL